MIEINDPVLHIQVADRQPAELRDAHPSMEQDVKSLIIFTIAVIIMNELEEFPHLVPGERIPSHTVVDHHTGQFKAERILVQDIVIYRQLESRPQHTPDSFYTTVPLPFTN